jgi:uncharacterized C2H2 Zn-finger protein
MHNLIHSASYRGVNETILCLNEEEYEWKRMGGLHMSHKQRSGFMTCPKCGFQFNIIYARTVSCQGCSKMLSSLSCEYVKCPKCGFEFQVSESAIKDIEALKKWSLGHQFW